jgi:hypothetical protein
LTTAPSDAAQTLPDAVHNYFSHRERELRLDLIRLLRYEAVSLGIGVAFLMMCLGLRRTLVLHTLVFDRAIVDEGLPILGWVAMWRPMEILLYGWWPLARRRALLHPSLHHPGRGARSSLNSPHSGYRGLLSKMRPALGGKM